jgi:serine/threonine protein kinase
LPDVSSGPAASKDALYVMSGRFHLKQVEKGVKFLMNAEALINTMLGTCTLQKLIGQGGMGAVFLAQQSRPRRQVAVKVLLLGSSQAPSQQAAFLERFRRETDAAASLEHPNIVPVHEYGEQDGLAYLVMPYIGGGTLRDEMESGEPFPLTKVMTYLDQMAAALDFAHEHGVVHRDIKPANILMTPDRRLLLTDFGLVKVAGGSQGNSANSRLTAVGVPIGTPDYMSPEQVLGIEVDSRADLYSLGVILFQMVTGATPFNGDMPMQVAMQHLHTPPPSPRQFRPDLPVVIEQVVLRILAKRPQDRFANGAELASAFRQALIMSGVALGDTQHSLPVAGGAGASEARPFARRGLLGSSRLAGMAARDEAPVASPIVSPGGGGLLRRHAPTASLPAQQATEQGNRRDIVGKTSMTMPSLSGFINASTHAMPRVMKPPVAPQVDYVTPLPESEVSPHAVPVAQEVSEVSPLATGSFKSEHPLQGFGLRLGHRGLLRTGEVGDLANQNPAINSASAPLSTDGMLPNVFPASPAQGAFPPQEAFPTNTDSQATADGAVVQLSFDEPPASAAPAPGSAAALVPMTYEGQGMTGTIKLTQPMKVVKVPVAGKPGTYMTGLLPVLPADPEPADRQSGNGPFLQKHMSKVVLAALALIVVVSGIGLVWLVRPHGSTASQINSALLAANQRVQATANASATAQASNIILEDSLSSNIHSWKEADKGDVTYVFKDGAYHITINNGSTAALADLPDEIMPDAFVYSLSTSEIKGDDTSVNNQFGLVFRLNEIQKNGQPWVTFYCFQVQNTKDDIEYQLRKYDSSFTDNAEKWSTPWHAKAGKEYHFGHGTSAVNTLAVKVNGGNFTFVVNGKAVGTFKDTSFKAGRIGMLVNQKGTEIAFSNLMLTHN